MERGDYEKAIKIFTVAFYSFRKAYHRFSKPTDTKEDALAATNVSAAAAAFNTQSNNSLHHCTDALFFNTPRRVFLRRQNNPNLSLPAAVDCLENSTTPCSTESAEASGSCHSRQDEDDLYPQGDEEVTALYCNPIHLPPDFPITKASCGFLSTAITFNLALANHLYGTQLQDSGNTRLQTTTATSHLKSAGRLYEYTLRLEQARTLQVDETTNHDMFVSPLVLMCVLNNLGHLHSTLQNEPQSCLCYTRLQTAVVCWMHFKTWGRNSSNSHDARDLVQSFMENCLLALQQVKRNTAVAA
jgi:hypothetical protein